MSLYNFAFFTFEQPTRIARGSKGRAKKPSGSGGDGGGGPGPGAPPGRHSLTRPVRGLLESTKIGPCVSFAKCMHQTGGHGCCFFCPEGKSVSTPVNDDVKHAPSVPLKTREGVN